MATVAGPGAVVEKVGGAAVAMAEVPAQAAVVVVEEDGEADY